MTESDIVDLNNATDALVYVASRQRFAKIMIKHTQELLLYEGIDYEARAKLMLDYIARFKCIQNEMRHIISVAKLDKKEYLDYVGDELVTEFVSRAKVEMMDQLEYANKIRIYK